MRDVPQAPGDWASRGACVGADLSYDARKSETQAHELIKRYCHHCTVLQQCRAWALTTPDPAADHVAGGMTVAQRRKERKVRAA